MKTTRRGEWRLRRWIEMKKKQPVKFYILVTLAILCLSVAVVMSGKSAAERLRQVAEAEAGGAGGAPGEPEPPIGQPEQHEPEQSKEDTEEGGLNIKPSTEQAGESRAAVGESKSSFGDETQESREDENPESTEAATETEATTEAESAVRITEETTDGQAVPGETSESPKPTTAAGNTPGNENGAGDAAGGTNRAEQGGSAGGADGPGAGSATGGTGGVGAGDTTGGTAGHGSGGTQESKASGTQTPASSSRYSVNDYGPGATVSDSAVNELGKDAFFSQSKISDVVFERIYGKSYKEGSLIPRDDLRYIMILYYDFNGNRKRGEIISNKAISQDLVDIFKELYDHRYPIEKISLIDEYDADDDRSSSANNSSCFNYRTVAGKSSLSLHAKGLAIDINPKYNPTVVTDEEGNITDCFPDNAGEYADRSKQFKHKIDTQDLCYRLFMEHGFVWGGNWSSEPAYMHFSKSAVPEQ